MTVSEVIFYFRYSIISVSSVIIAFVIPSSVRKSLSVSKKFKNSYASVW